MPAVETPIVHALNDQAASDVPVWEAIRPCFGSDIAWPGHQEQTPDDVDAVSSLSEPYGPDRTVADRGGIGAALSQPRSARRLRPAVRPARRGPRADLAHLPDLYPSGLWHRPGAGRQSRAGSERASGLRDAVRLAAAFQKGSGAGAAAHAAGGADVRPLRDAAARHGEDAAAGPRRLHHRLAQSARHSARRRTLRPRRLHRAPDRFSRSIGSARAHGRSASPRCRRSPPPRSCRRTTTRRARQP